MKKLAISLLFACLLGIASTAAAENAEQPKAYPIDLAFPHVVDSIQTCTTTHEAIPFSFDCNGYTVFVSSAETFKVKKLSSQEAAHIVIVSLDISSLPDNEIPSFCQSVTVRASDSWSFRATERMYSTIAIAWPDTKTAQFVLEYDGEHISGQYWYINISHKAATPYCYVTTKDGTEPKMKEYKNEVAILIDNASIKGYFDIDDSIRSQLQPYSFLDLE